jgi:hypothetical protein
MVWTKMFTGAGMAGFPENFFSNPVWHLLQSNHRKFAKYAGHGAALQLM